MKTYHLHLKRISKPKHTRLKFDLKKLKYPNVLETFQANIGGKFAPLIIMNSEDTDMDTMMKDLYDATRQSGLRGVILGWMGCCF